MAHKPLTFARGMGHLPGAKSFTSGLLSEYRLVKFAIDLTKHLL
jgi:hypothetical protein